MIHESRRGHFGGRPGPELMIIVAVIAIIAAFVIPLILKVHLGRDGRCLDTLLAGGGGNLPADARCPVTGEPYRVDKQPDGDHLTCTGTHLATRPVIIRMAGSFDVRQAIPDYTGISIADWHRWATLSETADGALVEIRPHGWWRWGLAPFLGVVCLFAIGSAIARIKEDRSAAGCMIVLMIIPLVVLGALVYSMFCVEKIEISRPRHAVVRRSLVFGRELFAAATFDDARAIVVASERQCDVEVVSGPLDKPVRSRLFNIPKSGLGVLGPLNAALGR